LEANARYGALADAVFTWIEAPGDGAVTSTITMTELLVQHLRTPDALLAATAVRARATGFVTNDVVFEGSRDSKRCCSTG
jgi:predicted nucleic acid-binding protein